MRSVLETSFLVQTAWNRHCMVFYLPSNYPQIPSPRGKMKVLSCVWLLWPHGLYSPWNSPGQNTGVGSLPLLQGIFPTQGWNPGIPHYRQILSQLSHQGSPRILEWVAFPFSRGSFRPRTWTGVSCIAGRCFTTWAIREAPLQDRQNHVTRHEAGMTLHCLRLHSGFLWPE